MADGNKVVDTKWVEDRLLEIANEQLGLETGDLKLSDNICDALESKGRFDQLDAIELILAVEEEFGFAIYEEEMDQEKFTTWTLNDFVKLIKKKLGDKETT